MISVNVSYSMLFRYSTKADIVIYVLGAICAIAGGAAQPFMTVSVIAIRENVLDAKSIQVIFGQFTGTFQKLFQGTLPDSNFNGELSRLSLDFVYLGIGQFLAIYISVVGCTYSGEHVTQKLRERYLAAVLQQNIAFFDKIGAGEITSTITNNMDLVQCGISEKVALAISPLASFVTALIIGFSRNWRLSCVLLSTVFAVILTMGFFSVFVVKYSIRSLGAYSVGGTLAEEAISSIRTVTAMEGQGKLSTKYNVALAKSMHWGFRMKTSVGCMVGAMMSIVTATYAIGFWEGSRLLVSGHSSVAHTITVLMALMISAVSLARAAPHLRAFGEAIAAAENIFKIIDRPSPATLDGEAPSPNDIRGELKFRDVKHIYPSRPGTTVLENFNLIVPAGKVTALVGSSGSGKSTIVGLVERFYSPVHGQIFLDGLNIQTLDLKWLRRQISLVGQEPVLFNCSIRQNIEHGLIGTNFENAAEEKRLEVVIQAARMANAHEFITSLPSGYNTTVGANGVLLSGGKKQRIAIARAVISDPKILLLDEATSALDSQSEGIVQEALNVASQGRTTIVIAHRLSTIKAADNIVVLSKGQIIEQGSHDELVQRRGPYFKLIEIQRLGTQNMRSNLNLLNDDQTIDHGRTANEWEHTQEYIEKEIRDLSPTPKGPRAQDDGTRYTLWTTVKFIAAFNKKETHLMILGLFFSIVAGGAMPVQGVLFAKCISSLSLPSTRYSQLRSDIDFWPLMYFVVAVVMFLVSCGYGIVFAYCSELL
jgi:ATP-binding cassette subfamily B (MDR/TAP) protein 1